MIKIKHLIFFIILHAFDLKAADNSGMPQLNPDSFASQLFWLTILFLIIYILNHYIFLPKIVKIRKERDKTIEGYLKEAKEVNMSVETLIEKIKTDFNNASTDILTSFASFK
jgi:F-type H+-transporting ATPase subunit b